MAISTIGSNSLNQTSDLTINGLTVGKGGGAVSTNTAVGASALNATATGGANTAIGQTALNVTTSGANNTGIGVASLLNNTTGATNSAVGVSSLRNNTSGASNVAFGVSALESNTTASNNTAVGYQAGYSNTTGADNITMGAGALYSNTTGGSNTAVGRVALFTNTTGANNTAIGSQALYYNTNSQNTSIGYQAGYANTSGSSNICVGYQTGNNITTGTANTLIGTQATVNAAGDNFEIVIGNGNVGKGSQTGYINPAGGSMYQGSNTTTWATTSDRRLKKNIVDNNTGLEKITALQVRNFEYRLPEEVTELNSHNAIAIEGVQLGVIAQEIQQILPDCVKTESSGVMSVQSDNLVWYLVNSVKELKTIVDTQAALISRQATEIAELKAKVG
jgi:hypothetical protein